MKALGIGNAIIDVICKVEDDFLKENNFKKCPEPIKSGDSNSYAFKGRPKKDNSKKTDYFSNCRCCGQYISNDYRANLDKRYCQDCLPY